MQPSQSALQTLQELADADAEFALELAVSPRVALGRVRAMLGVDDHQALMELLSLPTTAVRPAPRQIITGREHIEGFDPHQLTSPLTYSFPTTVQLHSTLGSWQQVLFSRTLAMQSHETVFFGRSDLDGADTFGFEEGGLRPIGAQLETSGIPFAVPVEAQLYARDPEEVAAFLEQLPIDPELIRSFVSAPAVLPDAVAILAPPSPATHSLTPYGLGVKSGNVLLPADVNPNTTTVDPLRTDYFYRGATPEYIDSNYHSKPLEPPVGSVRGIKVQQLGACAVEQYYNAIFDQFRTLLHNAVQGCELTIHTVTLVPMVRGDGRVQLFLNVWLTASDTFAAIGFGCELRASAVYELGLDNGALVLTLAKGETEVGPVDLLRIEDIGGNGCADFLGIQGAHSQVEEFLRNIPMVASASLRAQQIFPPARSTLPAFYPGDVAGPLYQLSLIFTGFAYGACTPSELWPDPKATVDMTKPSEWYLGNADTCAEARDELCRFVRRGFQRALLRDTSTYSSTDIYNSPGCGVTDGDPRLAQLFDTINEMTVPTGYLDMTPPHLAHWNCQRIDDSAVREMPGYTSYGPQPTYRSPTSTELAAINGACRGDVAVKVEDVGAVLVGEGPAPPYKPKWYRSWEFVWRWVCPSEDKGVCVFVPPIRRIVGNPDSVAAVFLESNPEEGVSTYHDAALVARLVLEAIAHMSDLPPKVPPDTVIQNMCSYARPAEDVFWRPFEIFAEDDIECTKVPSRPKQKSAYKPKTTYGPV